ncbi:MAG: NAD-dependent deacetylase [Sulfurimonas sp.]|nr:NAD-dependent deacetylase [Sulfurimonas sp.]MDD3834574.1 NAD-dependent deacetylase [Sulfurimonas sp.]
MAKVVILSGAGISAESGISTFRDSDGLWEHYDIKDICTAGCLETNRAMTVEFYDKRRLDLADKEPNKAHRVIAELKAKYKDEIAIITQNVDDLFEKAGIVHEDVVHLHGYLTKVECEKCGLVYDIGYKNTQDSYNGKCPTCGSEKIRPFIVMFGEAAPMYAKLNHEINDCELLVIIGTSGNVISVDILSSYVDKTILNNLEPSFAINDELYTQVLYKKATEAIDEIASDIEIFLEDRA